MRPLDAEAVGIELVGVLKPIVGRCDAGLADQIRRAANSMVLNIAEADGRSWSRPEEPVADRTGLGARGSRGFEARSGVGLFAAPRRGRGAARSLGRDALAVDPLEPSGPPQTRGGPRDELGDRVHLRVFERTPTPRDFQCGVQLQTRRVSDPKMICARAGLPPPRLGNIERHRARSPPHLLRQIRIQPPDHPSQHRNHLQRQPVTVQATEGGSACCFVHTRSPAHAPCQPPTVSTRNSIRGLAGGVRDQGLNETTSRATRAV